MGLISGVGVKGQSKPTQLKLTPRGLVGFDIALVEGTFGVFFRTAAPASQDAFATRMVPMAMQSLKEVHCTFQSKYEATFCEVE